MALLLLLLVLSLLSLLLLLLAACWCLLLLLQESNGEAFDTNVAHIISPQLNEPITFRVNAQRPGFQPSEQVTHTILITEQTPAPTLTLSPVAADDTAVVITMTTNHPDADIYFVLDDMDLVQSPPPRLMSL